jgi:hypothetical protein
MAMNVSYFPRECVERLIVIGRVGLALFCLLVV